MKRSLFAIVLLFSLFGCSKEDNTPEFNYDISILVGKWRVTNIQVNGNYVDVTTYPWSTQFQPTYATFNADGSYSGSGEYGAGQGTYKASGNTITTYIAGSEYLRYDIVSLSSGTCEVKMYESGSSESINLKCRKE